MIVPTERAISGVNLFRIAWFVAPDFASAYLIKPGKAMLPCRPAFVHEPATFHRINGAGRRVAVSMGWSSPIRQQPARKSGTSKKRFFDRVGIKSPAVLF
jgi:hypothetical protein